jgi:hypothetical protein
MASKKRTMMIKKGLLAIKFLAMKKLATIKKGGD